MGMEVEDGYCIQAVSNLYGFPPAGQNFSIEFDKCVMEWDMLIRHGISSYSTSG